jgi:CRP/FNR family transcriptional regulator
MTKLTDELRRIPYLGRLSAAELDPLVARSRVESVAAGATAFIEGEPPRGIFLVLEGRIRLLRASAAGREQVRHEEGPGATLAEVPVFDGGGYVGTAVAVEDSVLLFVPRAPLLHAIERNPSSALEVIRVLAARVRRFAALVEDLSTRGVAARLAAFLLRENERSGRDEVELPATRDQLAAHLGTVREQASRALSELRRSGVIELDRRRVRVKDARRLRALAGGSEAGAR